MSAQSEKVEKTRLPEERSACRRGFDAFGSGVADAAVAPESWKRASSHDLNHRSDSMKTETIDYRDGDVTLKGFLAYDEHQSGKRPGVLVMPEAFGLGAHAKQRAERIAGLGYVALAGDPYGNGVEAPDLPTAMKYATPLREDPAKFRQRARVALDKLASMPQVDPNRLAAIGYCMRGTFSLELARDGAPLTGAV